jgi:hypothetical protein
MNPAQDQEEWLAAAEADGWYHGYPEQPDVDAADIEGAAGDPNDTRHWNPPPKPEGRP